MISLLKQYALEKKRKQRELHQVGIDSIKIYNTATAYGKQCKSNPFAGDTTVLDWTVDNRSDSIHLTEEEVLDSVLFRGKRFHVKKSDVHLVPDMVSEEIKDYYRQKIWGSALRSAKNYRDKCV